jgi:cell division protein FtsI/penicillin-binding protein 2
MYGLLQQSFFYLTTGESDTPFGYSTSSAGIIIAILVVAIFLFYLTLKIYDMYKQKHWSERSNRIHAVRGLIRKIRKEFGELDSEDLISNDLITLYEYYERSMDKLVQDLGREFVSTGTSKPAKVLNTKN